MIGGTCLSYRFINYHSPDTMYISINPNHIYLFASLVNIVVERYNLRDKDSSLRCNLKRHINQRSQFLFCTYMFSLTFWFDYLTFPLDIHHSFPLDCVVISSLGAVDFSSPFLHNKRKIRRPPVHRTCPHKAALYYTHTKSLNLGLFFKIFKF